MRKLMPEPQRLEDFLNSYMELWHKTHVGREVFNAIKCPVLFIVGDGDMHAPVRTVMEAKEMTSNSYLCVIPNAGHTVFIDNYSVSWAAISQFINASLQELEKGTNTKMVFNFLLLCCYCHENVRI